MKHYYPIIIGCFLLGLACCRGSYKSKNEDQDLSKIATKNSSNPNSGAKAVIISPQFPSQTLKPESRPQTVESYPKVVSEVPVRSFQMVSPSESPGSTASGQTPLPTRPPIPKSRLKAVPANR